MKLITLNTWGGRAGRELILNFFKKYKDVDIFCLQEIWSAPYEHYEGLLIAGEKMHNMKVMTNIMQEVSGLLSDHSYYFYPLVGDNYGLQLLIKNEHAVKKSGEEYVYKHKGYVAAEDMADHGRPIQYATFNKDGVPVTAINFHGLWEKRVNGKHDSENRINQSKNIVKFIESLKGEYILSGDLNILPDTESITILEKNGMRNLIKEYGITSTRTSFYDREDRHADYIFTSRGIDVKDFKVLPEEVSDHSALYLDFE